MDAIELLPGHEDDFSGARLSPRQFKFALVDAGLWPTVYGAMHAIEQAMAAGTATDDQIRTFLWWSTATEIVEGHPALTAAAQALGIADRLPEVIRRAAVME